MKNIYIIVIIFGFVSCKLNNSHYTRNICNENKKFKNKFFKHINYIEENITIKQDEKFKNSLNFISKYVNVSFNETINYANTYPFGVFKKYKTKWLKWYDENKCKNIKLKE